MNDTRFQVIKGRTRLRPLFFLLLFFCATADARAVRITILHFADYHSHAVPFYDDGRHDQGGIARAIGYLRREKRRGALVFSGGDMINKGSPAWSDQYGCAEWPWLDGIVDAMAFGNHDADYGEDAFERCRASVKYPILSANTAGIQPSVIVEWRGIRIGVFAVAGADFRSLVKAEGLTFSDPIAAARDVVHHLREDELVDAVVMIGHEHLDDDFALARAVPGIDVILGSHSHLKRELTLIDGTKTWFISPSQYLTYISRVELTFELSKRTALRNVTGRLVRVDERLPVDRDIEARVQSMQRALERDPQYAPLFVTVAELPRAMSVDDLAARTVDIMRRAAQADVALSTASSFRQALPPGGLTLETLRAALPYDNEILVYEMSGEQLAKLLAYGRSRAGTDAFAVVSESAADGATLRVATTDYLAKVAAGYRDFFAGLTPRVTGLHVRDEVRKALARTTPSS